MGLGTPPNYVPLPIDAQEGLNALLATAVGLIAGFVANGLILAGAAHGRRHVASAVWQATLASVLGASALARLMTHNARGLPYDYWQFFLDLGLVVAASIALGATEGDDFPTPRFWKWAWVTALFLYGRNVYLNLALSYYRPIGSAFLLIGTAMALAAWRRGWRRRATEFGLFIIALALLQIVLETVQ